MKKYNFILLIDDDPIANFLTERLLMKLGATDKIMIANNGIQALKIIQQESEEGQSCPDLILLDINMPVMSGVEFLHLFNKHQFKDSDKTTIVVLSTTTHHKDRKEITSFGVNHILQKPLTESKLSIIWE